MLLWSFQIELGTQSPKEGYLPRASFLSIQEKLEDFPGDPVVKNPSANAGDMDSMAGPGILHLLRGHSLYITTTEPGHLEPVLHKRSHPSEKPTHLPRRLAPAATTRESPHTATKTQRCHNSVLKF